MRGDPRSYQVAVVPDSLLESLLPLLEEERWGVIQLPPGDLDDETADAWLEQVAEHVPPLARAQGSREGLSRHAVVRPPPFGTA